MSRHFSTSWIAGMPIDQVCARLAHATGSCTSTDTATNTTPLPWWHAQIADPDWLIDPFKQAWEWMLRHWMYSEPVPPWWRVLANLASEYARTGQTRDGSLSDADAARWLLDWIDATGWEPAAENRTLTPRGALGGIGVPDPSTPGSTEAPAS